MKPPRGAEPIIAARMRRERPVEPVIVSFVGQLRELANPQVFVTGEHDWTFATDLDVVLYARVGANHFSSTLRALAPLARDISIWDVDLRAGMTVWGVWRCPSGDLRPLVRWQERRTARFVRWVRLKWCPQDNRIFDGREDASADVEFCGNRHAGDRAVLGGPAVQEPADSGIRGLHGVNIDRAAEFQRRFEMAGRALT